MERLIRQEPLLLSRVLLALVLLSTVAAGFLHHRSALCRALRSGGKIDLVLVSPAPALAVYEPAVTKLAVMIGRPFRFPADESGAAKAAEVRGVMWPDGSAASRYFELGADRDGRGFWNGAKNWFAQWHARPVLLVAYAADYRRALKSGATDITPYEFMAISLELTKLAPRDLCAVSSGAKKQGEPAPVETAAFTASVEPLKLEVLNASGRRGYAVTVTVYLRELAAKEALPVDVLSYDNYSRREKKSRIISRTGRIEELTRLGERLGLSAIEITAASARSSQTDASLIVGEDLLLPAQR